jgi:DNA-binding NtrC family response regulator
VGTDQPVPVDVRLVCATNRALEEMVADGSFREDLLYRVNTIEVTLPPLRERLVGLPALVEHFVRLSARKYRLAEKPLSEAGLKALRAHHWPGNIRELSHAVERALILSDGDELGAADFQLGKSRSSAGLATLDLEVTERNTIQLALEREEGNISRAAKVLGITRAALYRRIEKHGL